MNRSISLLLNRDDAELRHKIREIAPELQFVSRAQLQENPALWPQIEIAYDGIRGEDFGRATHLKWLQNSGAGVNQMPLHQLQTRDLILTNTSGIHARCIAEHLFGMLLLVTRELDTARQQQARREWKSLGSRTLSLYGKTLGVLGAGEIGAQLARVGRAFSMEIVGLRRSGEPTAQIETMFSPENKTEFFARSSVVMNTLPLTDSTRDFVGESEFDVMPPNAIYLSAGRGATTDTSALVRALQNGRLRAAMLDVTEPEPLPADHVLWELPGAFITPHFAGAHPEYNAESDAIFLDNLRRYLQNEPLHHVVDFDSGY